MHSRTFFFLLLLFIEMSQTANLISQYIDESLSTVEKPVLKFVLLNPLSFPPSALIPQQKRLCVRFFSAKALPKFYQERLLLAERA